MAKYNLLRRHSDKVYYNHNNLHRLLLDMVTTKQLVFPQI